MRTKFGSHRGENGYHIASLCLGEAQVANSQNVGSAKREETGSIQYTSGGSEETSNAKDVKNEGRSGYVYENTQTDD